MSADLRGETLSRSAVKALVFFAAGTAAGFKPLADPDLGWHLAGGLWMLEYGRPPAQDFLAAGSAQWVCYSWLFELFTAALFNFWGFAALVKLQALLVGVSWALLSRSVDLFFGEPEAAPSRRAAFFTVLLTGAAVIFAAPICQLRPQLISFIFAVWLITRLYRRHALFIEIVALTVIWAKSMRR